MSIHKINRVRDVLTGITDLKVYHYNAPSSESVPYCVWYEDGETASLEIDNGKGEQAIGGYVDYYTQQMDDVTVDAIQDALQDIESCYWALESVIYGDPTHDDDNLIHYAWRWVLL